MLDLDHPLPTVEPKRSRKHPANVRGPGFVDAAALTKHNDFEVPSAAELRAIKPGAWVKVCRNGERFWLKLTGYVGKKHHGIVANRLSRNADLPMDTPLFFMKKHIYAVRV